MGEGGVGESTKQHCTQVRDDPGRKHWILNVTASSLALRYTAAVVQTGLSARTRTGAGAPWRVLGGSSAAAWGVAAGSALASAPASATRARAAVAGAAVAIHLHADVGRLSLNTNPTVTIYKGHRHVQLNTIKRPSWI